MPYSNSPHSLSITHPHLVLAVTAASHPPTTITMSRRYVNSLTVFTSSHNFSSCSTASPIFPSHFLHVKFLQHLGVSLLNPAHLSWNHLPHCRHKIELTFNLKLQTPHGSTLLLDMPFVVMPIVHYLGFPKVNFQTLALKSLLPFYKLIHESLDCLTDHVLVINIL